MTDEYDLYCTTSGCSNCCGAASLGEVHDGLGICAGCRDWAEFNDEDEVSEFLEENAKVEGSD